MPFPTPRAAFLEGLKNGAPFVIVVAPFALLFGVLATEAGLNVAEVMGFSVLVIAGAAQFTALQLMSEQAPTVIILVSALAVNLRMAMYSASLVPFVGSAPMWQRVLMSYLMFDQNYALSITRFETDHELTVPQRVAYYFGAVSLVAPLWYVLTYAGAVVGQRIPEQFALDFAVPVTFLALIAPALRTVAHLGAALVSVVFGLLLAGVPYNLGLLIAASAAILTGAEIERRMTRGLA